MRLASVTSLAFLAVVPGCATTTYAALRGLEPERRSESAHLRFDPPIRVILDRPLRGSQQSVVDSVSEIIGRVMERRGDTLVMAPRWLIVQRSWITFDARSGEGQEGTTIRVVATSAPRVGTSRPNRLRTMIIIDVVAAILAATWLHHGW